MGTLLFNTRHVKLVLIRVRVCRSVGKRVILFYNSSNVLKFTFSVNFSNFHAILFNSLIFLIIEIIYVNY